MKTLLALFFVASIKVSFAEASAHSRGCIYADGGCVQQCEEGTHAYSTGCGYMTPEATCDNPCPEQGAAMICDYSACYCDEPTVRDTTSNRCVTLDKCPGTTQPSDDD